MVNNKKVSDNGDTFFWSPEICNTGTELCTGSKGILTIPQGVELIFRGSNLIQTPTYNKGIFNLQELTWFIGDIEANNCHKINFEFKVTDISLGNFNISFVACSSCNEDQSDNISNLLIEVVDECELVDLAIGPDGDNCDEITIKV